MASSIQPVDMGAFAPTLEMGEDPESHNLARILVKDMYAEVTLEVSPPDLVLRWKREAQWAAIHSAEEAWKALSTLSQFLQRYGI